MNDIKKVMVAIDFSKFSTTVLEAGQKMAAQFNGEVEVVFVVESLNTYANFVIPHTSLDVMEKDLVERAGKKMEEFIAENRAGSLPQKGKVLSGDIAEEIVNYAETQGFDMVVMGTHACRGLERALYGSVTEKVVKMAPCPVLTMNPC